MRSFPKRPAGETTGKVADAARTGERGHAASVPVSEISIFHFAAILGNSLQKRRKGLGWSRFVRFHFSDGQAGGGIGGRADQSGVDGVTRAARAAVRSQV